MKRQPDRYPTPGASGREFLATAMAAPLLLAACTNIWNAGDLAGWVRDRAVEQGCQRETISLDEWYTEEAEGNVWHGTCRDTQGIEQSFGINVDSVWKPSKPAA